LAVEAMADARTPVEKLSKYIDACFYWTAHFRTHSLVWLSFLHRCAGDKDLRDLNTLAASTGADRIAALLQEGKELKVFSFDDAQVSAKVIQTIITGSLVVGASENLHHEKAFAENTKNECLRLVGVVPVQA
jgi:hypothetical protein